MGILGLVLANYRYSKKLHIEANSIRPAFLFMHVPDCTVSGLSQRQDSLVDLLGGYVWPFLGNLPAADCYSQDMLLRHESRVLLGSVWLLCSQHASTWF